jgi:hypothetical protein
MKTKTHEILQSTMNITKVSQDATENKAPKVAHIAKRTSICQTIDENLEQNYLNTFKHCKEMGMESLKIPVASCKDFSSISVTENY